MRYLVNTPASVVHAECRSGHGPRGRHRQGWSPRPAQPRHPRHRGTALQRVHHPGQLRHRRTSGAVRRQSDGHSATPSPTATACGSGSSPTAPRCSRSASRTGMATSPNVALGFRTLNEYVNLDSPPPTSPNFGGPYFGETIGRYANRIGGASFKLNGTTYTLPVNNGPNTLHGGFVGWGNRIWQHLTTATGHGWVSLTMSLVAPNGDEGRACCRAPTTSSPTARSRRRPRPRAPASRPRSPRQSPTA